MKKRIISILILCLLVASVFALSSCGKDEAADCPECEAELAHKNGMLLCENQHFYRKCINEDCAALINALEFYEIDEELKMTVKDVLYCVSCGTNQIQCPECYDQEVDGVYCSTCGRQVLQSGEMKFEFDFDALGESAMILCKGMLGIFIVTGIIISFILILNTAVEKIKQSKENKE